MRRLFFILTIGVALVGCTAPAPAPTSALAPAPAAPLPSSASTEVEQAERPQRVAYALKSITFITPDSQLMQQLKDGLATPPADYFSWFPSDKRDRASELWSQEIVPEILSRFPELKEVFAGVFADILTTDELRRLAEIVDHPGTSRLQNKQPISDKDAHDLARLGLVALSERLQQKRSVAKELMRTRSEEWAISVVGDLMRRKPRLFAGITG